MKQIPLIRNKRNAIIGGLIGVIPMLVLAFLPSYKVYVPVLCLLAGPLFLMPVMTNGGLVPACAGAVAASVATGIAFGAEAGLMCALYIVSVLTAFVVCRELKKPFWTTCAYVIAAHALSQIVIYVCLQALTGWDLYAAAGAALADGVNASPDRNYYFLTFYQAGLVIIPEEMVNGLYYMGNTLFCTEELTKEFLNSLRNLGTLYASALIPNSISYFSILSGVFAPTLAFYFGARGKERREFRTNEKDAFPLDTLGMPPMQKWFIPRGWGIKAGVLCVGYLIALFSENAALSMAGAMMYSVFSAVYGIQGLAYVNYIQNKAGSRPLTRKITMILLFALLQQLLPILGVADQVFDPRKLRKPLSVPTDKEDDEL